MYKAILDLIIKSLLLQTPVNSVYAAKQVKNASGDVYPAYYDGKDYVYCGASDTDGVFAYIRERTEIKFMSRGSSGANAVYDMEQGFRLVICGKGRNYDSMKAVIIILKLFERTNATIDAVITDSAALFDKEQNAKSVLFMPQDLYFAVDFTAVKTDDLSGCKDLLTCYVNKSKWEKCDFPPQIARNFSDAFDMSFS